MLNRHRRPGDRPGYFGRALGERWSFSWDLVGPPQEKCFISQANPWAFPGAALGKGWDTALGIGAKLLAGTDIPNLLDPTTLAAGALFVH